MSEAPDFSERRAGAEASRSRLDTIQEKVDAQEHVCTGEPPSLMPHEKCDDAVLADTQKLIAAGKRMAEVVERLKHGAAIIGDHASDYERRNAAVIRVDVAAKTLRAYETGLLQLITFAETGK